LWIVNDTSHSHRKGNEESGPLFEAQVAWVPDKNIPESSLRYERQHKPLKSQWLRLKEDFDIIVELEGLIVYGSQSLIME
jgi:hypothetical protein